MRDFRNLARVTLELPAAGIAVVGDNGHGKTNLVEAIAYLRLLRSVRGARDAEVVRFGAEGFSVRGEANRHTVVVGFERATKRKRVAIDGGDATRLSDALGAVPSVTISPLDVELVRGGPSVRRRLLDILLATTSRAYLAALQSYRGALARRNAALRSATQRASAREAGIAAWEPILADSGAVLWAERAAWVTRWAGEFARICAAVGESGVVAMRYVARATGGALHGGPLQTAATPSADGNGGDAATLRRTLEQALASGRATDLRRGMTRTGPHRDDLALTLDGRALQTYGSAGQQRTIAIALRVLEAATIRVHTGGSPVLLFDDPLAELDERRAHAILRLLSTSDSALGEGLAESQVILAVPRATDIPAEFTRLERWRIIAGVMERGG